jgi:hypothetical protein
MILYNIDESTFSASEEAWWLYKKEGFYASFTNAPFTLSAIIHNPDNLNKNSLPLMKRVL